MNLPLFLPTLAWSECEKVAQSKGVEKPLNNYP